PLHRVVRRPDDRDRLRREQRAQVAPGRRGGHRAPFSGGGGGAPRPHASTPPSTTIVAPVTYAPPAVARNAINAATSSGRPSRPRSSGSRTSAPIARHAPPAASIAARVAASGSSRRPQTTTLAPVLASSSAVARPMPLPPPVTSATRPAFASERRGLRKVNS